MDFVLTAKCENGHEQQMFVDGMLGLKWVEEQAALIDGTSSMYLVNPVDDPQSIIGKCGICQARFSCKVEGKLNVSETVD